MSTHEPTVSEFMTKIPATADKDLRLSDARERMFIDHIRHLVVLQNDHLCGVLSVGDITLALSLRGVDKNTATVGDAMTKNPYVCLPTTPISEVAGKMEAHGYGCTIVVDASDEVVGIFTTTDALRALRQAVTGKQVEPLTESDHLPTPAEAVETQPYRVRHHRSITQNPARLFTTSTR